MGISKGNIDTSNKINIENDFFLLSLIENVVTEDPWGDTHDVVDPSLFTAHGSDDSEIHVENYYQNI